MSIFLVLKRCQIVRTGTGTIELQEMEEQDTVSTVQCSYGSGDTASRDCPRYIGGTRQGTGDKSYKI